MPTITDREAEIILEALNRIRSESRSERPRTLRTINLADKVTVIIKRAKRRKK